MDYIVTITSKNYIQYTYRLIYSLREIGYRGEIVVLTSDDGIYCNNTVIKIDKKFKCTTPSLDDNRWLQFQLLDTDYFKDGDKIIYLDSDVVVTPDFDYKTMFEKYTFCISLMTYDVVNSFPELRKILNDETINVKYIATPFIFKVNKKIRQFFKICKVMSHIANQHRRGTLFTFNLACYTFFDKDKIQTIPEKKCMYGYDIESGKAFVNPILIHYGGGVGRKHWNLEYPDNKPVAYIVSNKKKKITKRYKYKSKIKKGERYLFQTDEGLGNQIETYLTYRVLVNKFKNVDIVFAFTDRDNVSNMGFNQVIADYYGNRCYDAKNGVLSKETLSQYKGLITGRRCKIKNVPVIYENNNYAHGCEVERNYDVLKHFGYTDQDMPELFEKFLPLDWKKVRGEDFCETKKKYDVVICNGSKHNLKWIKKRYLRMDEVAQKLAESYEVACVGLLDEYIPGCADYTHLGFMQTLDFISQAKVALVGCSGLFHFVNVIGGQNVAVYGPTDTIKNTHIRNWGGFHKNAIIVKDECCPHQPCQRNWRLQPEWFGCKDYQCMYFDPEKIVDAVRMKMLEIAFEGIDNA